MRRGYADTPGGQVHYQIEGSGEPILLLHSLGLSADEYTEIMPFLSRRHRVVAPDFPGYGNSDIPAHAWHLDDYVRNIISFLDTLGIEKASVFGRLTGATVAVAMAVDYPERVNKLILSSCIYAGPEVIAERLDFFSNPKRADRMIIKEDGSHLVSYWKDRLSLHFMNLEMAHRYLINNLERWRFGTRVDERYQAVFSYDIGPKLRALTCPTLLLYGGRDKYLQWLDITRQLTPRCQTEVMEGT